MLICIQAFFLFVALHFYIIKRLFEFLAVAYQLIYSFMCVYSVCMYIICIYYYSILLLTSELAPYSILLCRILLLLLLYVCERFLYLDTVCL